MKTYLLKYQKNIRDLGGLKGFNGKTVKYGRLYRGGALSQVAKEDIPILESFHLTDIVDFRGKDEFINNPDYRLDGVKYHSLPTIKETVKPEDRKVQDGNLLWFIDDTNKGFEHLLNQYVLLIKEEMSQKAYKEFFKILLHSNRTTYFHCSQGKDRGGLAAFFIEYALGVDMDQIMDDYLYSNIAMDMRVDNLIEYVKDKPFYNEGYRQSLLAVFSAKREYLEAAIKAMDEYGGPLEYIKNILDVDVDKLRELYLE